MKELLTQISQQAIALSPDFFTEEEKSTKWIGRNPATAEAIHEAEAKLSVTLPKDVVEFYKNSNGTSIILNQTFGGFVPIEKIDWLKNVDAYTIECYAEMGKDYVNDLSNSIIISGIGYVHNVLLIQPYGNHKEWRYWEFASYIPGESPFQGLKEYLQRLLDFLTDQKVHKDEATQRVIYLNGYECQFCDESHLTNYIKDQATTRNVAMQKYTCMKLILDDSKLKEMYCVEQGKEDALLPLQDRFRDLNIPVVTLKTPRLIAFKEQGVHTMGGAYPEDFSEPNHDAVTPFQYIGCIRKSDENFDWLPFDLHICFPIYLHCSPLYFDYSNPSKPVIINIDDVNNEHSNFEPHIHKNSIIEFDQALFDFVENVSFYNEDGNTFGHAGIANYSQVNHLPLSPKTGQLMPFVCQLMGGVKMRNCDVKVTEEYYQKDLQQLNFWGDAYLMVYCEQSTKIVCCLISH
jgi:hypothetical protein